MKTLFFDCFSGAAGDMIVGALIDAGADFDAIKAGLDSLGVDGYVLTADKVVKKGTTATQFKVHLDESHGHPHRHLRHIVEIIEGGDLPEAVKKASLETFERIAEAEAEVHGSTPEKIHFHEVGAVDSIMDIVGAHLALDQLNPERILATPLHVGSGTVKCAHGVMPVPAPATALLLKGLPTYGGEVEGELVTPTGAALIAQLAEGYGGMPAMEIESAGYGSGERDLPDRPNVLRVLVGNSAGQNAELPGTETVTIIEANVDDMVPELIPPLIDDLLDAGARDAYVTPYVGKKGRAGHQITVIAAPADATAFAEILFRGSTTLGVRIRTEHRVCLDREWKTVSTQWGLVRVKCGFLNGEQVNVSPEYEECARLARESHVNVLKVYQTAQAAAVKGEFTDE